LLGLLIVEAALPLGSIDDSEERWGKLYQPYNPFIYVKLYADVSLFQQGKMDLN
jgi:hypothetical protein